jgi:hypothetical protein
MFFEEKIYLPRSTLGRQWKSISTYDFLCRPRRHTCVASVQTKTQKKTHFGLAHTYSIYMLCFISNQNNQSGVRVE